MSKVDLEIEIQTSNSNSSQTLSMSRVRNPESRIKPIDSKIKRQSSKFHLSVEEYCSWLIAENSKTPHCGESY